MSDSLIGRTIAGYRVERLLGRGGMASVYFAWDTKNERAVALKVMDERYRDTPSYVERFVREAQAIASWDNPHIVRVLDAGEEDQIYYYAMEFIRGLDLAQLLRQYLNASQLMPYTEVVNIGWAVADALDYAHERGIVHRDVKPSNVLVSVDGRILLSDFGLVMDINRGTLGETFGSPAYIAPEQARSSAAAVPQSDLYSMGVMLYEMLTGVVPFYDQSPTALALKHLTEEPPRPRSINPRLTPPVEAVLMRALRKQPAERYATGREMMIAMERALGEALVATEVSALPLPDQTQVLQTQRARPSPDARPSPNPVVIPPPPGSPLAGGPGGLPPVRPGAPSVMSNPARPGAYGSAGGAGGGYGAPPYGGAPARGRGGRSSLGCIAVALAALALIAMGAAAFFASGGGRELIANLGLIPAVGQREDTPAPADPGEPTRAPTQTKKPTRTPKPSETPEPAATATAEPTETPAPTDTAEPTFTPSPTSITDLLLAKRAEDGFVLANIGDKPLPVPPIELRGGLREGEKGKGDPESTLYLKGESWQVKVIEPGQCVSIWVKNAKPKLPDGTRCEPVGRTLAVEKKDRFWTLPVAIFYGDTRIYTCQPDKDRCTFNTSPEKE